MIDKTWNRKSPILDVDRLFWISMESDPARSKNHSKNEEVCFSKAVYMNTPLKNISENTLNLYFLAAFY
jgi:hypothetical protein